MITDEQYRRLMKMRQEMPIYKAADKSGMSEKTANPNYSYRGKNDDRVLIFSGTILRKVESRL